MPNAQCPGDRHILDRPLPRATGCLQDPARCPVRRIGLDDALGRVHAQDSDEHRRRPVIDRVAGCLATRPTRAMGPRPCLRLRLRLGLGPASRMLTSFIGSLRPRQRGLRLTSTESCGTVAGAPIAIRTFGSRRAPQPGRSAHSRKSGAQPLHQRQQLTMHRVATTKAVMEFGRHRVRHALLNPARRMARDRHRFVLSTQALQGLRQPE